MAKKKNNFRPFLWVLPLLHDRHVSGSHRMQFHGKLMIQTQENGEKPHFGPDLGTLGPNSSHQNFFSKIWFRQSLDIMVSYHRVQYTKKLMIQS